MFAATWTSLGMLVATTLEQSWRASSQAAVHISLEQFDEVTPLLYESGAAGLGWWRIRETEFCDTASGELLHQAFRLLALQGAIHQAKIQKVFRLLREAEIEPILIKGWAIARLYPDLALRPYGDIDLMIQPRDYAKGKDIVQSAARDCAVDFHAPAFELEDRPLDDLYRRSQLVPCGKEQVRILSPEDHFALLAVHFLKHGAWRPLWLCDIGLLLERMSAGFDWAVCLGTDRRRANWILSAAGLAHKLLNAQISDEQIAERAAQAPGWLCESVLKQWERPFAGAQPPVSHHAAITSYLRDPRGLLSDLIRRWPSPIVATISVNGIFGARPRVRYQLGNCCLRFARLVIRG